MREGVARRVLGAAGAWVLVLAVVRVTVLLPERCPPLDAEGARAAVVEAVGWFERNQEVDGRWLYRYDRAAGEVVPGYNVVRHSGVAMSLYQAAGIGVPGALASADRGVRYALDNLRAVEDGAAFVEPGAAQASTGATALLLAGLVERRAATGDELHDAVMADLATFLAASTEPGGAVRAGYSLVEDRWVDAHSPFFTGEVFWALALAHEAFPDQGWDEPARRIGRYLATERDKAEGYWPDVPDHWAAYGFAVVAGATGAGEAGAGAAPWAPLSAEEVDYLRRQAAFGGVQVRYESQRVDEFPRWVLRGRRTLGAGLGTVGEQLGGLWVVAGSVPALSAEREALAERLACAAGMLADRQVTRAGAGGGADPGREQGAWFQFDVTQMDDQQHAMSALILALPVLEERTTG